MDNKFITVEQLEQSLLREEADDNKDLAALSQEIDEKLNVVDKEQDQHIANKSNPHVVTKEQVGLGNVENKSSETIRGEITKENVVTALGYTPPETDTKYTHPTTAGNKHIPAGGTTNQILVWDEDGAAKWGNAVRGNWNQNDGTASDFIKGRTHYKEVKEVAGDTLTWDGNTEEKTIVEVPDSNGMMFVKLSDATPSVEDMPNGVIEFFSDGTQFARTQADMQSAVDSLGVVSGEGFWVFPEDNYSFMGVVTIPEAGLYVNRMEGMTYHTAITIPGYTGFVTKTETVKTLDYEYLPEPLHFGEEVTEVMGDTLTWDGNTEGLVLFNIGHNVYKVSDAVPTMADLENGATIKLSDSLEVTECDVRESMPGLIMIDAGNVVVISESVAGTEIGGIMLPEAGTYLYKGVEGNGQYVASLTIPGYTGFKSIQTTVTPIKTKYLPEHLQFGTEVTVGDTLTWDGNTEGRVSVDAFAEMIGILYKISDAVPTLEDCISGATYTVVYDGEQENLSVGYDEIAEMSDFVGCLCIGDLIALVAPENNFQIEIEGVTAIFPEAGLYTSIGVDSSLTSLTIPGYKFETKTVKTIDLKYIPDTIARKSDITGGDWSVNDPDAPGYVKNRTHWEEVEETEIVPLTTVSAETEGLLAESELLTEGTTYKVLWNGVEYIRTAQSMSIPTEEEGVYGTVVYVGNVEFFGGIPTDGDPFIIASMQGMTISMDVPMLESGASATVAISTHEEIIHKLDPKFYYRPCYYEPEEVILPETTVEFVEGMAALENPLNLVIGEQYSLRIHMDGLEFSCYGTAKELVTDGVAMGIAAELYHPNYDEVVGAIGTIYPEFVEAMGAAGMIQLDFGDSYSNTSFPVTIVKLEKLVQLDEKLIPDTIARAEDIPEIPDGSGFASKDDLSAKMNASDPVGTGSFSMNRKADTTIGHNSFALGSEVEASGRFSHAEGRITTASGENSHAEGWFTTASGESSHAEGSDTEASGNGSHAEGVGATASGNYSHAEGAHTTASGESSHAEGNGTTASGMYSHAEGRHTTASGRWSHAEGEYTTASGDYQHVQGTYNIDDADGKYAHIVGMGTATNNRKNAHTLDWNGLGWFAGGLKIGGTGQDDENAKEVATKDDLNTKMNASNPVGTGSFSMGRKADTTVGTNSFASGGNVEASGIFSHAEGYDTTASGYASHAEGGDTTASGVYSHAEGWKTTASNEASHAEGYNTTASGIYSHAEGRETTASSEASHAEGYNTTASGYCSHAEGRGTIAFSNYQHVQGRYNIEDSASKYAHIVGNGVNTAANGITLSNAHTLDWDGLGWFAGGLKVGGTGQDDPNSKEVALKTDIVQPDWNQNDETASDFIKGRTHYKEVKEVAGDTVTWDGNTEGYPLVEVRDGLFFIQLSEAVPLINDFSNGCTVVFSDGSEYVVPVDDIIEADGFLAVEGTFYIAVRDGATLPDFGTTFPKAGIYTAASLGQNEFYISSLTIPGYTGFVTKTETVKTLDYEYLPEPLHFGEEVTEVMGDTLTWDGNTEGLAVTMMDEEVGYFHISDAIPTIDELKAGFVVKTNDSEWAFTTEHVNGYIKESIDMYGGIVEEVFAIVYSDNLTIFGLTFSKAGVYFVSGYGYYTESMTIPGYKFETKTVKPLDEKYLPMDAIYAEIVKRLPIAEGASY